MARMIPPRADPQCVSLGEHEIFQRLKDDPATRDWIVLHSLDIAQHARQVAGEVDFVIIVPNKGVVCLEVKACSMLRRAEGAWYYGRDPKPDYRGPFRQASESLHSIREKVLERRPDLARVVFWSAVIFPYVDFTAQSNEWHCWQVIDRRGFRSQPLSRLIERVIDNARLHLQTCQTATWFWMESKEPYLEQCSFIADVLRPDFELYETVKARLDRLNIELKRYTEEQLVALDAMENNPRVSFVGPAGTGKTFLAIEAARRSAGSGRNVLFICYNRLLGAWLESQTKDLKGVTTRTIHKHMLAVTGTVVDPEVDDGYWNTELPIAATDSLLGHEGAMFVYDELIVDEAQDVLLPLTLDFLDLSLKGGLAAGRWRLFGDFHNQQLYACGLSLEAVLRQRTGERGPIYNLGVNCRNTPRVAALANLVANLQPGYIKVLRPDDGVDPDIKYYGGANEQEAMLISILEGLYAEGYTGNDISILSPKAAGCCSCQIKSLPWNKRVKSVTAREGGCVGYCTIQAFKGLESSVVITTDIERLVSTYDVELFYVAATRATQRLIVLAHSSVRKDMLDVISKRRV